jgi:hypothetical protein
MAPGRGNPEKRSSLGCNSSKYIAECSSNDEGCKDESSPIHTIHVDGYFKVAKSISEGIQDVEEESKEDRGYNGEDVKKRICNCIASPDSNHKYACQQSRSKLCYALHLRFVCPRIKTIQKKMMLNSPPGNPHQVNSPGHKVRSGDKRRFYLYDDLRIIFPQRHADSDEGKVSCCP